MLASRIIFKPVSILKASLFNSLRNLTNCNCKYADIFAMTQYYDGWDIHASWDFCSNLPVVYD